MRYFLSIWLFITIALSAEANSHHQSQSVEKIQLATVFNIEQTDRLLSDYLVSEKLDGIRARWTGSTLLTRNGNRVHAPAWFFDKWPKQVLDGELWVGRGHFELTASIVLTDTPDARWQQVRFMVFDMPELAQPFHARAKAISRLVADTQSPTLKEINQFTLNDHNALKRELDRIVALGGEGLMLHHRDALYKSGRSEHLLKVKQHHDAEARVIAHLKGKGQYSAMMGSLLVETREGIRFKLGSGFSKNERLHPPPIGSWVTFKYFGFTRKGKPRFASFLHIRPDSDMPD